MLREPSKWATPIRLLREGERPAPSNVMPFEAAFAAVMRALSAFAA